MTTEQNMTTGQKKPFYKRAWFIVLAVVVALGIAVAATGDDEDAAEASRTSGTSQETTTSIAGMPAEAPAEDPGATPADVPQEFRSALASAETYSEMMHMSKAGIFDQLTSEYADQFTAEAAQYAVDTVHADWNNNALESARGYQDTMNMSPAAIRDQLTSEYGGRFTEEEADFAIAHLGQ